ncbi:hypothetical protein [Allocoleopsis sp.]|uniref:hypothetical protein n=1 Tax=Allocoleopsis sp. TaxID=3088169 RepID=UPI002FCEB734
MRLTSGVDWAYFFLLVQTVVNIISIPPTKMAIASPPATQFSHSVFSITLNSQRHYFSKTLMPNYPPKHQASKSEVHYALRYSDNVMRRTISGA